MTEYRYEPTSPFARADAFFVANMEQGVQGEQPITTGYDVDELIAHLHRSAETGEALEVDWRI
jgi:acid phosphatase class B